MFNCTKILITVFIFVFSNACKIIEQKEQSQLLPSNITDIYNDTSIFLIKDTFYFENSIEAYVDFDAIVQNSGFIHDHTIDKSSYDSGIFIFGFESKSDSLILFLDSSHNVNIDNVGSLWAYVFFPDESSTIQYLQLTNISPMCNSYYTKYYLEIKVLFVGKQKRRVPLFLNCDELDKYKSKNNGLDYELRIIPVYMIIDALFFKRID